jgi:hypothetical protein
MIKRNENNPTKVLGEDIAGLLGWFYPSSSRAHLKVKISE